MNSIQRIIVFLFTFGSLVTAQGQEVMTASVQETMSSAITEKSIPSNNDKGWVFFVNQEQKTCYIDFEQIHANLSDIVVKNTKGDVIFREAVLDLPVNTVYELDLSLFDKGEYLIEVHSVTGIIRQKVKS